ncbi:bridging integrator 3, isoform CRA_b, partial [Mus musculus]
KGVWKTAAVSVKLQEGEIGGVRASCQVSVPALPPPGQLRLRQGAFPVPSVHLQLGTADSSNRLEEQTKRLQKDMKKSTDADLAMSKSAVKISQDLLSNPLCEQDQDFLHMVTALDTAMKRMDAFNQEKVNQIQKTVIEPLKKFSSIFPSLNMAVKRREQALQDYGRL